MLFVNVIAQYVHGYIDLTEEKRYTLTPATEEVLEKIEDRVSVQVLLNGEFPAGFKRLRAETIEMLKEFKSIAPLIEYDFEDPTEGEVEDVNERIRHLAKDGITPTKLRLNESNERSERLIYPYAIFRYGSRMQVVNLLEPERPGVPAEVTLNNSVALLEYKMADAVQKLFYEDEPVIAISTGHGELNEFQTKALERMVSKSYYPKRIFLDSVVMIDPAIDILMIAKPLQPFSNKDKFKIDQYIMNGGNVMFFLDKLNARMDSIGANRNYIPKEIETGLDDLLFKYGARLQSNLVLDLQCTRIPLKVADQGGQPQFDMFPWYYHILASGNELHPMTKNMDKINFLFASSIDSIKTKENIRKTPLIRSSKYTRYQRSPVQLNFDIMRFQPDETKFNKEPQVLALLLEGKFGSAYAIRVTESMRAGLEELGQPFRSESVGGKVLVVSDGDLVKNLYNESSNNFSDLGYNQYEKSAFRGNKDFILNACEYMIDANGILDARAKEVKLRLLDTVKARTEKTKWQLINILLPLVFLGLFGILYNLRRKRKYAH